MIETHAVLWISSKTTGFPAMTSTSNQDCETPSNRRFYHRYTVGIDAQIEVNETFHACKVMDLSLGGAGIEPGFEKLIGTQVRLTLNGGSQVDGIPAEVIRSDKERCNLSFKLDDIAEEKLIMHLMADPATRD